ncbi:SpoIIE family protein phosphatase [Actinosynnema sp. NPDC020468]|uniref:GAF domain-containing SpoIIE family protein phosphatase n=1 Tax=Actinosynnema sp. NPDC020468 TaxID=3154488 RepID=UPI0033FF1CD7
MSDQSSDRVPGDLARGARVRATGLGAAADPVMDRFADLVRIQLRVPVALVSLVEVDRQVLPGAVGLARPWSDDRQTPLSHSFCRHVVATGGPLVVADARLDDRLEGNLAIRDLDVIAYAGMPLTDGEGTVLGSLCAIDSVPREWTESELGALADLAVACATELRLRLAVREADVERARTAELAVLVRQSAIRDRLLLVASQALAGTMSLEQIRYQVTDLVSGELAPTYVGLSVIEPGGWMRRIADPRVPFGADGGEYEHYPVDAPLLTARVARERRMLCYEDRAAIAEQFPAHVVAVVAALDVEAICVAPLVGTRDVLGVLVFGWDSPRPVDDSERAVISTIAAYTAQALERARYVEDRVLVVRRMQEAMLSDLPDVPGLRMAARYLPADTGERVGGDWYDAVPLPTAAGGSTLAVTVGDITGHDIRAATLMAQVRSMLRQAAWDHRDHPPSTVVTALEDALAGIRVPARGTLLHAHLREVPEGRLLTWTNAGHPPPVLVPPDGPPRSLEGHDILFGFPHLRPHRRTDHEVLLLPGSTLFLHTDGLVERRDSNLDDRTAELRALLATTPTESVEDLVDTAARLMLDGGQRDDVVALAIHVPRA